MDRNKQKEEAIRRLGLIDIWPEVITLFKNDELTYSEPSPICGLLSRLDSKPDWLDKVRQVEEEYDILVYHVVYSNTEFGELLTLLYVSKHEEEWESDRADLSAKFKSNIPTILAGTAWWNTFVCISYCINLTYPELSEFGSVSIAEVNTGLMRIE